MYTELTVNTPTETMYWPNSSWLHCQMMNASGSLWSATILSESGFVAAVLKSPMSSGNGTAFAIASLWLLQPHCNVPEWLYNVFNQKPWAEASMTHKKQVACNSSITLLNFQTGDTTFTNLQDAKAVRDNVLQIRKV